MNIVAFVLSLLAGLLSFLQGGCGTVLSGVVGSLAEHFGDYHSSRIFAALGGAGLLVMLASILGIIGGSLALGRKKSSTGCLCVSAGMCGLAFFMNFKDAAIYGVLYAVAAFCARVGNDNAETQGSSTHYSSTSTSSTTNTSNTFWTPKLFTEKKEDKPEPNKDKYEPVLGLETNALIKRAFLFLEDGEFDNARRYLNQALNQDAEDARVHFGQLMCVRKAHNPLELVNNLPTLLEKERLFQRALRFADEDYKKELEDLAQASRDKLEQIRLEKEAEQERINAEKEKTYQEILALKEKASTSSDFQKILGRIPLIRGYKDIETISDKVSQALKTELQYQDVLKEKQNAKKSKDWQSVITHLSELKDYKDAKELLKEAKETFKQVEEREYKKLFLRCLLVVVLLIAAFMAKPFVCYQIGKLYEDGGFVEKNLDKAREWYLSAGGMEDNDYRYMSWNTSFGGWGVENNSQSYKGKAYFAFVNIDAERGNSNAQHWLASAYYYARGVEQDYSKAFEWFKKVAEQGEISAQEKLAEMYEEGKGVEKNLDEARKWYLKIFEHYKKGAEQGEYLAKYYLAGMYARGEGVERNINEAIKLYQKVVEDKERSYYKDEASEAIERLTREAEEARILHEKVMIAFFEGRYDDITSPDIAYGNPAIINMLALVDYEKIGENYDKLNKQAEDLRKQSPSSSKDDYEAAIKLALKYRSSIPAYKFLGDCYLNGWGVEKNANKAFQYFNLPAESGDIYSQIALASIYDNILNDKTQAAVWYQKLADSGNAEAQNKLREFQERQKAQEAEKAYKEAQTSEAKGNIETALEQYRKAMELGHSEAQKRITSIQDKQKSELEIKVSYAEAEQYLNDKNYSQAFEIFRRLANAGYAPAQDKLAWMYQNGWGVDQSYAYAVSWFRKAAEQGNTEALASMGLMYYRGWGVRQDYDAALLWYRRAAAKGSEVAERRINSIILLKANKHKIASIENKYGFPIAGKIFAETLSVRQSPNTKSRVLKTLKTGHPVSISKASESDDDYWFYIKTASGTEGWVLGGYVTIIDRDLSYEESRNRRYSLPKSGYVRTSSQSSFLNLRNIPAIEGSQVVEKLDNGERFTAYEIFAGDTMDWYRIKTSYSGNEGWVSGKYIELNY